MTQKDDPEAKELKNFPEHMAVHEEDKWENYQNIERLPRDKDLVTRVSRTVYRRIFPVLSALFILSVLGISLKSGTHFLFDKSAYLLSLLMILWVAIAPITVISMRYASADVRPFAKHWYFGIAGGQALCGILFYALFPDNTDGWLGSTNTLLIMSIPMHVIIYLELKLRLIPKEAVYPLKIFAALFCTYGILFA